MQDENDAEGRCPLRKGKWARNGKERERGKSKEEKEEKAKKKKRKKHRRKEERANIETWWKKEPFNGRRKELMHDLNVSGMKR